MSFVFDADEEIALDEDPLAGMNLSRPPKKRPRRDSRATDANNN